MATDYDARRTKSAEDTIEELTVRVIPRQANEFTCSPCFLVQPRNRLALQRGDQHVCVDCV